MKDDIKKLTNVVQIDEGRINNHLDKMVKNSVEETLNQLLDAEADDASRVLRTGPAHQGG